jgi:hypothetical protein
MSDYAIDCFKLIDRLELFKEANLDRNLNRDNEI